jgi:GNAT superfamily N-acetyltransferase
VKIIPFTENLISAVKKFTDQQIGENYYTLAEMAENQKKSITADQQITSFVLISPQDEILGLRLAYAPGRWAHGKGSKLQPELWPFKLTEAGYFQSLFLSPEVQGQGFGPQLSQKSTELFLQLGAKGIVTHCWKESPNCSSFKYLQKFNFISVAEYPEYWIDVDYICPRDGSPCRCTAIEMIKEI